MRAFKLTIAYDGTGFVGWQRQPIGTSIQGLLEDACRELDGRHVAVAGAGRTDAGVHALGQTASVMLHRGIDGVALVRALNARLPGPIRVLAAEDVPTSFHARFDAGRKTYRYRIWNHPVLSPFERAYAWHVPRPPLDIDAMARGAAHVVGRHDFAALQATGGSTSTTERVVRSSDIRRTGSLVTYEICGEGFLRHMVRIIAGTLFEVGCGRRRPEWIDEVLASRDRQRAGKTAPAHGLFLVRVDYPVATGTLAAER